MQTCYRHPNRETGVSCSNCGNPICPDCMTPTPVGMRCPDCSKQRTQVKTVRSMTSEPTLTYVLIALNVLAFVGSLASGAGLAERGGGSAITNGALNGPAIEFGGEYYRLITSGFLHAGFIHIAFNMYLLYVLGQMIEPSLGKLRFGLLYFTSLLAGSFGALLFEPNVNTVGASGAVFGLMGAAVIMMRARGIDPMQSGIGTLLLLNLGITFLIPGISIGGHIGGLAGGLIAGYILEAGSRLTGRAAYIAVAGCVVVAAASVVGAIAVAGQSGLG